MQHPVFVCGLGICLVITHLYLEIDGRQWHMRAASIELFLITPKPQNINNKCTWVCAHTMILSHYTYLLVSSNHHLQRGTHKATKSQLLLMCKYIIVAITLPEYVSDREWFGHVTLCKPTATSRPCNHQVLKYPRLATKPSMLVRRVDSKCNGRMYHMTDELRSYVSFTPDYVCTMCLKELMNSIPQSVWSSCGSGMTY